MDISKKTREELIAICKDKSIKGYSGKKKDEIIQILTNKPPTDIIQTPSTNASGVPSLPGAFGYGPLHHHKI